ncbi:MAG: hypothetical protein K5764_00235 [Prevotella sp.]|nr:hypothetical protein [Prevotella sp.]
MNKRFVLVFSLLCLVLSFFSCKYDKKPAEVQEPEPEFVFTKEDSATVISLVNDFVGKLQQHQLKEAVGMLYYLNGDTISELTEAQYKMQARSLSRIRGIRYELDYIKLETEKFNDAKINVVLFDKQEGDTRPNAIGFHLNPVRRDGSWYLTTPDNLSDTNADERPQEETF